MRPSRRQFDQLLAEEVFKRNGMRCPGVTMSRPSRSSPLHLGGTSLQRWRRDLLKQAMEAEGFDVYLNECWHFDYGEWRQYPTVDFGAIETG